MAFSRLPDNHLGVSAVKAFVPADVSSRRFDQLVRRPLPSSVEGRPVMPLATEFRDPLGTGIGALSPANDGDGFYVAQFFGELNSAIGSYHLGVDWNGEGGGNTDFGEPVYAVAEAEVVTVVDDQNGSTSGFGNYVVLRHELPTPMTINGQTVSQIYSLYGHMDSVAGLTVGQTIPIGHQIGTIGATGASGGFAHLHFEMTIGDVRPDSGDGYNPSGPPNAWIDPVDFISEYERMLDAAGKNFPVADIGGEILVNTTTDRSQGDPSVTKLSDGRFIVTWRDASEIDGPAVIRAQIFESDGVRSGSEFIVSREVEISSHLPQVASLSSGGFVIAWVEIFRVPNDEYTSTKIVTQAYNADGSVLSYQTEVTSSYGGQLEPKVTGLEDGGFVVGWRESLTRPAAEETQHNFSFQIFNDNGAPLAPKNQLSTVFGGYVTSPSLATLDDGRFAFSYSDSGESNNVITIRTF